MAFSCFVAIALVFMFLQMNDIHALAITQRADKIESVLIYGGEISQVTRSVSIKEHLPSGIHLISVTGLCRSLDDRSVEVSGVVDAEILDVKVMEVSTQKENNPEYSKLLTTLRNLVDELRHQILINDRLSVSNDKRAESVYLYIDHALNSSVTKTITQATELLVFQDQQIKDINAARLEFMVNHRKLQINVKRVEDAIDMLITTGTISQSVSPLVSQSVS